MKFKKLIADYFKYLKLQQHSKTSAHEHIFEIYIPFKDRNGDNIPIVIFEDECGVIMSDASVTYNDLVKSYNNAFSSCDVHNSISKITNKYNVEFDSYELCKSSSVKEFPENFSKFMQAILEIRGLSYGRGSK